MAKKIPYEENHRINKSGELEKKCSRHSRFFPDENDWFLCTEEYFYKANNNKTDGLSPWCKRCAVKNSRISTCNRKKSVAEYKHEYYLNNFEEQYYYRLKHAIKFPQKKKDEERNWRRNNKEKLSIYGQQHRNHNITEKQWVACKDYFRNEYGEWCCAYCGLPISQHFRYYGQELKNIDLHKEHFNDEGSNGLDNCLPSCLSCNSSKRKYKFEDWYSSNNKRLKPGIYSEERKQKILKWINEDHKKYI